MSSAPLARNPHPNNQNRRLHARRRIDELIYAKFGPENGGILLNLSEGGLSFQGVVVVDRDQQIRVNFALPGMNARIEATGQLIWSNDSGKGGGLRFLDLTEETRRRVKEWIAGDASSEGTFIAPVNMHSGGAAGLGASERNLGQSPPALDEKEQPKTASIGPEPRDDQAWQFSSSAPAAATVSNNVSTPASAFRILADTHESEPPSTRKQQYVAFATGVLAGCVVVLAAIAGMRMLGSAGGPTAPPIVQSPAAQVAAGPDSQNSPVDGIILNEKRSTSNNESVDTPPAAAQGSISKTPVREKEASALAASSKTNAGRPQDFRRKNMIDHENLALLAPHVLRSPSKPDIREPSIGDGVPPGFISMDERRAAGPSMPDVPKPLPPSPKAVDRTANFAEAVPIEHDAPIYPPGAKKNHIEGLVKLSATVGTDGVPRVKVVSGDPDLTQAAEEAVSRWRYVPAVSDGVPVESNVVVTIRFQLKP